MDRAGLDENREPVAERSADKVTEVPQQLDRLPDGRQALVIGDHKRFADYVHKQGDYPGYRGTCGICSCEMVLRMFGKRVNEASLVAHAIDRGLCTTRRTDRNPDRCGGTTPRDRVQILADYGVEAYADQAKSLEDVADKIEQGHGVILSVNAHALNDLPAWEWQYRTPNHAVAATAVARDEHTGELLGIYVNDSAPGTGRFIDAAMLNGCWLGVGGFFEATASPYLKEKP